MGIVFLSTNQPFGRWRYTPGCVVHVVARKEAIHTHTHHETDNIYILSLDIRTVIKHFGACHLMLIKSGVGFASQLDWLLPVVY